MINAILNQQEVVVSTATTLTLGYGAGQTVPPRYLICNPTANMTITLPLTTATIPAPPTPDSGYLPAATGVALTFINISAFTVTFAAATGDSLVNVPVLTTLNGSVTMFASATGTTWYGIGDSGGVGGSLVESANQLGASTTSFTLFPNTTAATYKITGVSEVHGTASSSGTLQVEKATGTQATGSGTNVLTGTMSLAGTANTTINGTLVATAATLTVAPGNRVNLIFAGTMTSLANCSVSVSLVQL